MINPRLAVVVTAADILAAENRYPEKDAELTILLKTVNWYDRTMWSLVRDLYSGNIGTMEFESEMIDIIQNQFRRAWNEGMRQLGLDPESDQTPQGEAALQDIMLQELDYVGPLAADVQQAAYANAGVDQFQSRVNLWSNRYTDIVNQAVQFYAGVGEKLQWHLGATEKHCRICLALDGIVAFASEWDAFLPTSLCSRSPC